ncbi:hypothetical protein G6212_002825 [Salmonella enterica subsp. enterica]|nr:hypothetical protein [Salmonella enterica subsp. enterica serovar Hvittingfoss]
MSDVKRYEIIYEHCSMYGKFIVEINTDDCYFSHLMRLYEFCNDGEKKFVLPNQDDFSLADEEDFQLKLVALTLKALARKTFELMINNGWGLRDLINYLEDNGCYLGRNAGIEIIDVPLIGLCACRVQVNEIQPCAVN